MYEELLGSSQIVAGGNTVGQFGVVESGCDVRDDVVLVYTH